MRRIALCLSAAVALPLAANHCLAQAPADPAGLQRSVFTLAGVRYQLLLPQRAKVVPPSGPVDYVIIRDESKSKRLERLLVLGRPSGEADAGCARTVTLASGSVLRYRVNDNAGGGSGGPIAELTGQLQIGTRSVAVACTDQDELYREPDWCVPYLHHLRIDDQR